MKEGDFIRFGGSTIRFAVVRSHRRRKTIAISLELSGDILVRAPVQTPHSRITDAVKSRAKWIIGKQRHLSDQPSFGRKEFVSGESFSYLGRHHRLKVLRSKKKGKPNVSLLRGRLEVNLNPRNGRVPGEIKDALAKWFSARAERRISERVFLYAQKMGLPRPRVLIRDQQKRWGSCGSNGTLRFNWRIIMAPLSLVDYVIVHELCHLRYKNHSSSFWKYLGTVMPDYEIRKGRLRREGAEWHV